MAATISSLNAGDKNPNRRELTIVVTVKQHDAQKVTNWDCMLCLPEKRWLEISDCHLVRSLENVWTPNV